MNKEKHILEYIEECLSQQEMYKVRYTKSMESTNTDIKHQRELKTNPHHIRERNITELRKMADEDYDKLQILRYRIDFLELKKNELEEYVDKERDNMPDCILRKYTDRLEEVKSKKII